MISLILNILWLVLGGIWMGLAWFLVGIILMITIIGIPWARACFVFASFNFWPFGREAIRRDALTGEEDLGTSPLGLIGNIVWVLIAGIWLCIGHVTAAIANALTIIGIPFAIQHLKLAAMALWPIGRTVVPVEVAEEARRRNAIREVQRLRG
jgi:uncharacterized membrane protein YccF (DUF307 family)